MTKHHEYEFSIPEPIKHFARIHNDHEDRARAYFRSSHPNMELVGFRNGKAVLVRKQKGDHHG